jgi:hypothetical protein
MLKTTKQRVIANLNDIDMVIEMEISDTTNFGDSSMFTSYADSFGDQIFSGIKET